MTPFFDPVAPRRARDRVPPILALGLFLPVSDFTQPENGLPIPPLPFPYTGCHQTASYSPKMAPLHFCTSGSEMPLTEEPGLYKRPCPRSPSYSVSTTNTLSGALCLRPLPSASRTSSLDCYRPHHPRLSHLLGCRLTLHKTDPPQDRWQDGDLERTPPTAHGGTLSPISEKIGRRRPYEETSRPFNQE